MGVDIFSINLDKPSRQYSPGENVLGKVFMRVSGLETTFEITVRFFGLAHTHWEESEYHSHGSNTSIQHYDYTGHDSLFDFAVRLFGDGISRFPIPEGDNVFPFAFQVPLRPLPVTCSFENGHVTYGLEGRVRKPWYSSDPKTDVLPVTIFTLVDLNITPGAANSMQVADSRSFGCCCPTAPCFLRSFSPKSGYCIGETVPLVVEIQNQSNRPIFNITATLTQVWTMSAYGYRGRHNRTHPIALQAAGHNGVGPGQTTRWDMVFTIPPTVPPSSNPASCDIVSMDYVINVNAAVDGCCCRNDNFGLTHPIVVGNVPLRIVALPQQIPKYNEKGGLA